MNKIKMNAILAAAVITANSLSSTIAGYILPKPLYFGGVLNDTPVSDQGLRKFRPGKHICYKKYYGVTANTCYNGGIKCPDGYQIYKAETHIQHDVHKGEESFYTLVYFINYKPVEAIITFNELTGGFDYNTPGTVIQKESERKLKRRG